MHDGPKITEGWGDPAGAGGGGATSWIHVPARTPLRVVVLSSEPVYYEGHWLNGRMRPCAGASCYQCGMHTGLQKRWAFCVQEVETGTVGLFEVGQGAAISLFEAARDMGHFRGLYWSFRKEGRRDRGKIVATREATIAGAAGLPPAMDVAGQLRRQWAEGEASAETGRSAVAAKREETSRNGTGLTPEREALLAGMRR